MPTEPYLGDIIMVPFDYAPQGWAQCNGQLLPINQYQALFSLLGTNYGGNGTTTFALPNLQGRIPICMGSAAGLPPAVIGATGGEASHTLTAAETPGHSHTLLATSNPATTNAPAGAYLAQASGALGLAYANAGSLTAMSAAALSTVGTSTPHQNVQPYLTVNFIIALVGVFPSRG